MKKLFLATIVAFGLASCGGSNEAPVADAPVVEDTTQEEAPAAETATANSIEIHGSDDMKFDKTEFTVSAGEITLVLKNVGEQPKETMGHNVVILKPGTEVKDFALAGLADADNDYINKDHEGDVIAHTKMLGPGEEDTITVTLEPGVYPFLCTFPGHFGTMQGTITVE